MGASVLFGMLGHPQQAFAFDKNGKLITVNQTQAALENSLYMSWELDLAADAGKIGQLVVDTKDFILGLGAAASETNQLLWNSLTGNVESALQNAKENLKRIRTVNNRTLSDMQEKYNSNVQTAIYDWNWILSEDETVSEISNRKVTPERHVTAGKFSELETKIKKEITQIDLFITAMKTTLSDAQAMDMKEASNF